MRKTNTSAIAGTTGMPLKAGTLEHTQQAYTEAIAQAVIGLIGPGYSPTQMYILSGCVRTGSGANYIISAGSVFYGGEVYLTNSANFTLTAGQVAIGEYTLSFNVSPRADGVEFTDGVTRSIHEIRTVTWKGGAGGSGLSNFDSAVRINSNRPDLPGSPPPPHV